MTCCCFLCQFWVCVGKGGLAALYIPNDRRDDEETEALVRRLI